ncbi:Rrf2 family transcriptional regulator [Microbacter margulisiae]|uniref:Rrf2 family protein n=1 Tax=Microbacter margulisiae TaxID=1350067 RepID=A0A7W5DRT8_9PORP|nr:Rrf2 family transcriptional regulator [Microbacter margulisiae]MBB3187900.1 Rrf2 family protein [Microbacter margulisiae]
MSNKRFATSIHILALLAKSEDELLCSDYIAGSININPVTVRKELSNLQRNGLITSKEGKNGGASLAKSPDTILLSDVYMSVRSNAILGNAPNDPNPKCPVGRQINRELEKIFLIAEDALLSRLKTITLADFVSNFD